jgi:hypothetical protein
MSETRDHRFDDLAFYVDRERINAEVRAWLSGPSSPVAVLTGPPGTGKSRYAHWLASEGATRLGVSAGPAIVRDHEASRNDDLAWPDLRDGLLKLAGDAAQIASKTPFRIDAKVNAKVLSGHAAAIENLVLPGLPNPVRELREVVVPALSSLPAGKPILLVLDGLDEAHRLNAQDFLDVIGVLCQRTAETGNSEHGLGRLRILLTSQPVVPLAMPSHRPAYRIDLAPSSVHSNDREALTTHLYARLAPIGDEDRTRLARSIADQAAGIWAIGVYTARAVVLDVERGAPVPQDVDVPHDLATLHKEAADRIRGRDPEQWEKVAALLALVAAAQELDSHLPRHVARTVLECRAEDLTRRCELSAALVQATPEGDLHFFHPDFGRWLANDGLAPDLVLDAHHRITSTLSGAAKSDWASADDYTRRYVGIHALTATELAAGTSTFNTLRDHCIDLYSDVSRLRADLRPDDWIGQLDRLGILCSATQMFPGTTEPIRDSGWRILPLIELYFSQEYGRRLSINQFRLLDITSDDTIRSWRAEHMPDYERVFTGLLVSVITRVLEGSLTTEVPHPAERRAEIYRSAWRHTRDHSHLVGAAKEASELVRTTDLTNPHLENRLIMHSSTLAELYAQTEDPHVLDALIETRRRYIDVPTLILSDRTEEIALLGRCLHIRGQLRGKQTHEGASDLLEAVEFFRAALKVTAPSDPTRTELLGDLADALGHLTDTGLSSQDDQDDFDARVTLQRELVASSADSERRAVYWAALGAALWARGRRGQHAEDRKPDLEAAAAAFRRALDETPHQDAERTNRMRGLAGVLTELTTEEQ